MPVVFFALAVMRMALEAIFESMVIIYVMQVMDSKGQVGLRMVLETAQLLEVAFTRVPLPLLVAPLVILFLLTPRSLDFNVAMEAISVLLVVLFATRGDGGDQ